MHGRHFYLKRTWNNGGTGFDIYDHFPLIAAFSFFYENYVFDFIGLKVKSYNMQHLVLFVFVAELSRSCLRIFFPTVLEGNRSAAKLGGEKTRRLQPEDRVFHRCLLFVNQNAELAEVSV